MKVVQRIKAAVLATSVVASETPSMSRCLLLMLLALPCWTAAGDKSPMPENADRRPRLRDLGLQIGVLPTGPMNSFTDVAGVQVGHCTIVEGDSIRTGVTVITPHTGNVFLQKVPAAVQVANGFGKFVGSTQIEELGVLETPIALTNTLSTFAVADALVGWVLEQPGCEGVRSVNPVVGECNDGYLNDIRARKVRREDVRAALRDANANPVEEGCVGAGTGTRCLGWKGGIGSSSRKLPEKLGGYTVGVLVQTNFGGSLTVAGVPVGRELGRYYLQDDVPRQEHGSCIVIIATDAPLDARQLKRLARRAPLGLAATGSPITHGSGDYVLAFCTAEGLRTPYESDTPLEQREILRDDQLSPLFQAVRDATEEAVLNSLLQAETTSGVAGRTVEAIDPDDVVRICRQHRVLKSPEDRTQSSTGGTELRSEIRTYGRAALSDRLTTRIAALEVQIGPLMKEHHVPGVAVTVISDRQLAWSRGYGVRCAGSDAPMEPETVMEACSMSKPFFAYLFLKLVEEQKFDLDRPLVEYLGGDYSSDDPRHRLITSRMALSHTTGLPNWRPGGWRSDSRLSLSFDPGTEFGYSGEGFLMLQRAMEKSLKTGLDSISQERLIRPLKLAQTGFVWDDRFSVASSCGHDRDGQAKSDRHYYDRANAGYTLYTSAEDYARFLIEIMKADRSAPHSISAEMRTRMLTPISHREDDEAADWGLGWGLRQLNGEQQVFHTGANGSGFRCYSEFFPGSGDGLVIMTNALDGEDLWKALVEQWHESPAADSAGSQPDR